MFYLETQRKIKSQFQKYKLCHIRIFKTLFIACFIHYWNFSQFYFCWYKSWPLNLIYNFLSNFVQSKTWRENPHYCFFNWLNILLSVNKLLLGSETAPASQNVLRWQNMLFKPYFFKSVIIRIKFQTTPLP